MKNITPKVDLIFKKLFGVEENKDLLISLINSIINKEDQVEDVVILNPYNPQHCISGKLSILDIKAKSTSGQRFNIEIQVSDEGDYDKRALYYWAKLYTEQLETSNDYSALSKAIGIHILNFTSITTTDKYHNRFYMTERDTGVRYFKDIELHTIELNKFEGNTKELTELVLKIKSTLDIWLAFLTKHNLLDKDNLPPELNDKNLKKALGVLDVMSLSNEEREVHDSRLNWLRIEASTLKKRYEEGRIEGKIEIARKMLLKKLSIDEISEITGLTIKEIRKLV